MENEVEQEGSFYGGVFIIRATELATKAVDEDKKENYEEAFKLYKNSLEYFLRSIKDEAPSDKAKELLRAKCTQYLDRAEQLKTILHKGKKDEESCKKECDREEKITEKHTDIEKLDERLCGAIVLEKPSVKFEDVVGLEDAKQVLKEAVLLPIMFPNLFSGRRVPWRAILLYGPPGAGKSLLAKAIATEAKSATFFSVSSALLVSKSFGEGENTVKTVFRMASEHQPSIIFIDDVDSLSGSRSENEYEAARRVRTEFLVHLFGSHPGMVIGATNAPWDIDCYIRRGFVKRIYIPLPGASARSVLFKQQFGTTRNSLTEDEYTNLGKCSDGYSGADISNVVRDAMMKPVRKVKTATHFRQVQGPSPSDPTVVEEDLLTPCSPEDPGATEMSWTDVPVDKLLEPVVSYADVLSSLQTIKATVSEDSLRKFAEFTKDFVG